VSPYAHYRLTSIVNGMGGQTLVEYSTVECPSQMPKQNSDANAYRCFPQYSTPIQAPAGFVWFNKYVVTKVTESDLTGGGPDEIWTYEYSTAGSTDNSLWAHDLSEPSLITQTSWGQWRGYSTVTVTHGPAGGPQTTTRSLYYRGMNGDAKKSGDDTQVLFGTRPASLTSAIEPDSTIAAAVSGDGGMCLDAILGGTANGTLIQSYWCNNTPAQVWQRYPGNTLRNSGSGRCLDLVGGGTADGTRVQLWDCNGAASQVWMRQPDGSIKNPASGRCLDLASFFTQAGGVIQIWSCSGGYNQVWQPTNTGGLTNPQSARCLDLAGPARRTARRL